MGEIPVCEHKSRRPYVCVFKNIQPNAPDVTATLGSNQDKINLYRSILSHMLRGENNTKKKTPRTTDITHKTTEHYCRTPPPKK